MRTPGRPRPAGEGGYTLVELIAVMVILMTIVTAITALFVTGARAELELSRRFEAQQQARVAADRLRREIHCASAITVTSAASIAVTIPHYCPTAVGGATTTVTYSAQQVSTGRFQLRRGTATVADYLTSGDVFSYVAPSADSLGRLQVDLQVNVRPSETWKQWRLQTDVVLRNTQRQT